MPKKPNWGAIVAVAIPTVLSAIWFYVQLQVWKEEGHDHMLTVANFAVTILLWAALSFAVYRYLRGAHRASAPSSEDWERDPNLTLVADASRDFSAETNPFGPWAYGYYRGGLGGEFTPHQEKKPNCFNGVDVWESESVELSLVAMHHRARNWIRGSVGTYVIPPDTICMHPGKEGGYAVVRWTCQHAGRYRISYEFLGLDTQTEIADSDIDVRHNMQPLCVDGKVPDEHNLNGLGSKISHKSEVLDLRVRDTIDFVVGWGRGRFFGSDSTGLKAKIYQLRPGI
jgi:hypothetical protein